MTNDYDPPERHRRVPGRSPERRRVPGRQRAPSTNNSSSGNDLPRRAAFVSAALPTPLTILTTTGDIAPLGTLGTSRRDGGPEEEESARLRRYFWGCALLIASGVFFVTSLYAIVFSKLMPPMGHPLLDAVREDSHYCYLVPLTVYPSCAALYMSWVSLKFFRHN